MEYGSWLAIGIAIVLGFIGVWFLKNSPVRGTGAFYKRRPGGVPPVGKKSSLQGTHPQVPLEDQQEEEHDQPNQPQGMEQQLESDQQHQQQQQPSLTSPSSPVTIIIQREHTNVFRLLLALDKVARSVMHSIFTYGTQRNQKNPTETLKEYLMNSRKMSNADYRKLFNRTLREKIESDPSCQTFDVSLWLPAIQWGCDGLAAPGDNVWVSSPDTLEYHLKSIKDFRNDLMHSELSASNADFYRRLEELRQLLIETLDLAEVKLNVDRSLIDQDITDIDRQINEIRDTPVAHLDLKSYTNLPLFRELQRILETTGVNDLVKLYDKLSQLNPASLIVGFNLQIKVNVVYTSLEIIQAGRHHKQQKIDHTNFLEYTHILKREEGYNLAQVILIEGVAGSGKTTFIKMLLSDWTSGMIGGKFCVKELDHYKFIIPVECRSRSTSSFASLISSLMPSANKHFQQEQQMMECLLDLPFLIIVDGLDEMNDVSKELFNQILNLKSLDHLTVICTTRPEKVLNYYRMVPSDITTVHIKIKGVPENKMESFIVKYHEELRNKGISKQETEGLIKYFKTIGNRLREHWVLPLNLSLLSILWASDSNRVNCIATPIDLLYQIHYLTLEKLLERLGKCEMTKNFSPSELEEKVNVFLAALCHEAIIGLRDDSILLREETVKKLTRVCALVDLPSEEALGAFLVQRNSWSPIGIATQVSFTHKSMQEFYATRYIYIELTGGNVTLCTDNVIKGIMDLLSDQKVPFNIRQEIVRSTSETLTKFTRRVDTEEATILEILERVHGGVSNDLHIEKYQNLLLMLLGFLYLEKKSSDDQLARELIELLRQSGVNDSETWISCLKTIRCEPNIANFIAQMPGMLDGILTISASNALAYATLLKDNKPMKQVHITIRDNPDECPSLCELVQSLANHQAFLKDVYLDHLFRNPLNSDDDNDPLLHALKQALERCPIENYMGQFTSGMQLPVTVAMMWVSVWDMPSYLQLREFLDPGRKILGIDISLSLDLDSSEMLPLNVKFRDFFGLYLPNVTTDDDIIKAVTIIQKLHPNVGKKKFGAVLFPRCRLREEDSIERLLLMLKDVKITDGLVFPSSCRPSPNVAERFHKWAKKETNWAYGVIWGKIPDWQDHYLANADSWDDDENPDV